MVGVLARDAHVQRRSEGLGERAEEVRHQLRRQPADLLAPKRPSNTAIGAAGQIDGHLGLRLVHRQQEAVARDADFAPSARRSASPSASAQSSTV